MWRAEPGGKMRTFSPNALTNPQIFKETALHANDVKWSVAHKSVTCKQGLIKKKKENAFVLGHVELRSDNKVACAGSGNTG